MNIGFIGLGKMGQGIVSRLLSAGHKVTGWNRNRDKLTPLLALGMGEAASPREAAATADIVFSSVTNAQAVREVALGENGIIAGLTKGSIYLDMSTIGPESSRAIAQAFAAAGLTMLDAPISGSPITVRQGKASIMVGGDRTAFERVKPVLLDIGAKATYIGANGFAAQMKLAINQLLIIEVIAFGEAVALAEKGGVPREIAVEAILGSVAASPVLGYRGPFILEGQMPEVPIADVPMQQKDILLALEEARRLGSPAPLAAVANEMMNLCRGLGLGSYDFVIAHKAYLRLGGQSTT